MMARRPTNNAQNTTDIALMEFKLNTALDRISKVETDMVTQDQFWPIKMSVYGFISLVLTGTVGALLALVLRSSTQ